LQAFAKSPRFSSPLLTPSIWISYLVDYQIMSILRKRKHGCTYCPKKTTHVLLHIVTYSGSIHEGTLLHSKSQYTTVKHSRQLFEHTYTPNLYGLGTLTPIEFFHRDLLWQSSNTHSHSCSQKASKHASGQSIVGLSVHLHTTSAPRRIVHH
jgi:hypothetical protein